MFSLNINEKNIKFQVKSDKDNLFFIQFLNIENALLISAYYNNDLSKIEYESQFELSYIQKIKLFSIYDNLNECLPDITDGIKTGKSSIIEKSDFFILSIPLNNIKYKKIDFEVKQKEKKVTDKVDELYSIIKDQKQEITYLKNKVNTLENMVKKLWEFKLGVEGETQIIIDSNIINYNNNYKTCLKNWINPHQVIKAQLLYRLSKDGSLIATFHKLCDNISPTLVLIESCKGNKFGGYTTCKWATCGKGQIDGKTFLFSLTKNKIFKKREDKLKERDIYCDMSYGPFFGGNDLIFRDSLENCMSKIPYFFLYNKDLEDNINNSFEVKEVEVYKILFE